MTAPPQATANGLRAVIFDMDGVLIDTEPAWRRVEIEVFASLGLHLTDADCRQTMGMRVGEVVQLWYDRHPWPEVSVEAVVERLVAGLVEHVRAHGEPMAGALEAVALARSGGLRCAIASSSPLALIDAVVERLGLAGEVDAVCSALAEAHGKPAPDVYLRAAALLDVPPSTCLAIEDSALGVLAARAAGMVCIAVPDAQTAQDPRLRVAAARLDSLRDLDRAALEALSAAYFS